MVTEKIKQLQELKTRAAKLEASVIAERSAALATLPEAYGFTSLKDFIKALKASAGSKPKYRKAKAEKPAKVKGKRKRAKITPEIKEQVKAAVEAGKTGAEIAKEIGISLPSVQNIKKELGLIKPRAAASEAPAAS